MDPRSGQDILLLIRHWNIQSFGYSNIRLPSLLEYTIIWVLVSYITCPTHPHPIPIPIVLVLSFYGMVPTAPAHPTPILLELCSIIISCFLLVPGRIPEFVYPFLVSGTGFFSKQLWSWMGLSILSKKCFVPSWFCWFQIFWRFVAASFPDSLFNVVNVWLGALVPSQRFSKHLCLWFGIALHRNFLLPSGSS